MYKSSKPPAPRASTAALAAIVGKPILGNMIGGGLFKPPAPKASTAALAAIVGKPILGNMIGGGLFKPPVPKASTAALAAIVGKPILGNMIGGGLFKPPAPKASTAALAAIVGKPILGNMIGGGLFKPPVPKASTAALAAIVGKPILGNMIGGGLFKPPAPKASTAALAAIVGKPILGNMIGGGLFKPPVPKASTAALAAIVGKPILGNMIGGGLFKPPELEHGGLTEPLLDVVGHTEVDWPLRSYEESEAGVSLEYMLGALNPAFAAQYRGWIQRSKERGPDWLRQAAASLRTLLLNLLHTAAPDKLVLPWVTEPGSQLDKGGHPTRRTKIAWLCSSVRNKRWREFVRMELDSALRVLDVLSKAVHVNEFSELEESFTSVSARVRFAIPYFLRAITYDLSQPGLKNGKGT